MLSNRDTQTIMGWLLTFGTIISALIVLFGGILHLIQIGNVKATNVIGTFTNDTSIHLIWQSALSFAPEGIIELGILFLIFTQLLRVGLLVWFYAVSRDLWFFLISSFIFLVMILSFFSQ